MISEADRELLSERSGLQESVRGGRLRPRDDWDPRLDFLSRGRMGADQLQRYDAARPALGTRLPPRPIVACWHYGWYGPGRRRGEPTTVRYLGGSYLSRDRRAEEEFNALKEEFGISADLLSWTDERLLLQTYERAYLSAANHDRRRFGLLYESNISLGTTQRIDFAPEAPAADKLVRDFRRMGSWLAAVDTTRLLRFDGRPVVFVFGSHTFGPTRADLPHVGRALDRARGAFAEAFGSPPWLIGDEALFPADAEAGHDRLFRAAYFDAVSRYHHYDAGQIRTLGGGRSVRLDATHVGRLVATEARTMAAYRTVRNRYSGAPLLVIPSSAAGFAKARLPSLLASRNDYTDLLAAMQELTDEHLSSLHARRLGTSALPAPLVIAGSWNEEFEGHALMPAASNRALVDRRDGGLDWLYALKSLYGWNSWALRS